MKTKFYIIVVLSAFIPILYGCSTYSPLAQLEDFSNELEYNSSTYKVEDWKNALQTYESILESFEGIDLTEEEIREFGRLNGICTGHLAKGALLVAKDASSSGLTFLEGLVDGLQSTISEEDITNTISSFEDRIEAIIEKFE